VQEKVKELTKRQEQDSLPPRNSDFRGVTWDKLKGEWQARGTLPKALGGLRHLGYFGDEEEAAHAYDAEACKHYDEETLPAQVQHGRFKCVLLLQLVLLVLSIANSLLSFPYDAAPRRPPKQQPVAKQFTTHRGVSFDQSNGGSWSMSHKFDDDGNNNSVMVTVGHFETDVAAAKAWDAAVRAIHTDESLAEADTASVVAALKRYGKTPGFNFANTLNIVPERALFQEEGHPDWKGAKFQSKKNFPAGGAAITGASGSSAEEAEEDEEEEAKDAASPTSSAYRGVSWQMREGQWVAQISVEGKHKSLGTFDNEEEAARAYDDEARKHHDEETLPMQRHYGSFKCVLLVLLVLLVLSTATRAV